MLLGEVRWGNAVLKVHTAPKCKEGKRKKKNCKEESKQECVTKSKTIKKRIDKLNKRVKEN